MPCWLKTKASVVLRAENWDMLMEAIENSEGLRISDQKGHSIDVSSREFGLFGVTENTDGTIEVRTFGDRPMTAAANAVNRAYSREIVKRKAKQFGWKLNETSKGFTALKRVAGLLLALATCLAATSAEAHHEEVVRHVVVIGGPLAWIASAAVGTWIGMQLRKLRRR